MKLTFYCQINDLNWSAVTEIPSRLRKFGLEVAKSSLELRRFPEWVETDCLVLQRLCAFSTTPPQFSATSCLMAFLGDAITLHSPIAPFNDFVLVPLTQIE